MRSPHDAERTMSAPETLGLDTRVEIRKAGVKLLEEMPEPWFRTLRDPYGAGMRGEDLDFCKRAQDLHQTKVMYVPKVQFGHVKELDLNEVTKYGLVSMRNIIEQVKKNDPESLSAKGLPDIRFQGEDLARSLEGAPRVLKVVGGGAV